MAAPSCCFPGIGSAWLPFPYGHLSKAAHVGLAPCASRSYLATCRLPVRWREEAEPPHGRGPGTAPRELRPLPKEPASAWGGLQPITMTSRTFSPNRTGFPLQVQRECFTSADCPGVLEMPTEASASPWGSP